MSNLKNELKKHTEQIFLFSLGIMFLVTRFYKLMDTAGLNCDETVMQYNIFSLAKYGVDRYNRVFPIYFQNRISGQSPLYVYLTVPLVKIFGFSTFICRIPQIIGGLIVLISGYLLVKRSLSQRAAYIYTILVLICPFFVMSERFALDCTLALPCMITGLLFERLYFDTGKSRYVWLTGIAYGLMIYSYIITVIFLFIHYLGLLIQKVDNRRNVVKIIGVTTLVCIPMIYFIGVITGILPELETKWFTISNVSGSRISEIQFSISNLTDLFKLTFSFDESFNFDSMPSYGTLYLWSVPLAIVGIFFLLTHHHYSIVLNLVELTIMYLFISNLATYKILLIFFPVICTVAYVLDVLLDQTVIFGVMCAAIYLVGFCFFYNAYLGLDHYLYFDRSLYSISQSLSLEEDSWIDTSGVFIGEGYVMLGTLCNPEDIVYSDAGVAIKIGELELNTKEPEIGKQTYYVRDYVDYVYKDNFGKNVLKIASDLIDANYSTNQEGQYYVFERSD